MKREALIGALQSHFKAEPGPLLASGGRFYAARLGRDTVVLDVDEARYRVLPDVSPYAFEGSPFGIVLVVEGDDSRDHPYPPFTDLEWLNLAGWPDEAWKPIT